MKTDLLDIRNCDCMDMMREYPDNHFELAIVDPPYGIGEDGTRAASRIRKTNKWASPVAPTYSGTGWDNQPVSRMVLSEIFRVSRSQIIWGANHFADNMPTVQSPGWIVWHKNAATPGADFADCELAYCSQRRAVKYFRFDWTGFGAVNAGEHRIHPTQKPVALYKWLLHNYAKEGDKILDTHMGSGSIAIACHYMGFNLTACELDTDYYNAACERIKRETAQLELL